MADFNDILGYRSQVKRARAICDYLKNGKKYAAIGAKIPKGVLISGSAGTGKSLFAEVISIEADRAIWFPAGNGKRAVRKAIRGAIKSAPSVILLDDLDYYPRESCEVIDKFLSSSSGEEVFIIATATDTEEICGIDCDALTERIILEEPDFEEKKQLFEKFISDKKVAQDFNKDDFYAIMQEWSLREAEEIFNEALICAVREGNASVSAAHVFKAAVKYGGNGIAEEVKEKIAYHEAGHVAVSLLLGEEAAYSVLYEKGGMYSAVGNDGFRTYIEKQNDYVVGLAGIACEGVFFGDNACGGITDLEGVSASIEMDNRRLACEGFGYYCTTKLNSPAYNDALMKKVQSDMQSYYDRAEKLISENKPLVKALAEALMQNKFLLHTQVHQIFTAYKSSFKT